MAGPWEKYGASAAPAAAGPWAKYGASAPEAAAPAAPAAAPVDNWQAPPRIDAQAASVAEAATAPPERGWGEYAWDTANIGTTGAIRGLSNTAGLLVDGANNLPRALNLLPGEQSFERMSDKPVMGGDWIYDAIMGGNDAVMGAAQTGLEAVGAPEGVLSYDPVARDPLQRGVARVGEEIGAAAVPAAGLIGYGARVGPQAARSGNAFMRNFVAPAAVNPAGFAASEIGMSTAAGTGATIANELSGNEDRQNPWIDMLGAFGGVGALATANAVGRSGVDLAAAATGSDRYASGVVREAVADQLIDNSAVLGRQVTPETVGRPIDTQDIVDLLMRQSDAEQMVPGFRATTADRAGDEGLAMLESARARQGGGAFRSRQDENSEAVIRALDARAPQEHPGEFSSALSARRADEISAVEAAALDAQRAAEDAAAPLQPVMNASGRGADIRAALDAAATTNQNTNVQPAWAPVNEADVNVNIGPLRDSFAEAADEVPEALKPLIPRAAGVPERLAAPAGADVETGLLDEFGNAIMRPDQPAGEMQNLRQVMGVRTALTNDLRREGITPQETRLIEDRVQRLDAYLDTNMPPELRQQYDTARAATRDHHDRFSRPNTAIGQTLRPGEGGGYRSDDSTVARRFVQGDEGNLNDMNSLFREAGNDPRAIAAVKDQVMQDARDRGALDRPDAAQRYIDGNKQMLNRFPELRTQLQDVATKRTAAVAATKAERDTIDRLTKPGKSAVAKYLSHGEHEAVDAIKSIMNGPRAAENIDELLAFAGGNKKAVEGARAAFWKHMDAESRAKNANAETASGNMPIVSRKLAKFLDDPSNRAVAERLYKDNPEHLEDLTELATALKGVGLGPRVGNANNPSGTALMMRGQSPVTMAELGSKFYQMQLGRVSPAYLAAHIAGKIASKSVGKQRAKAFESLLDKALTDPDVAKSLLMENNPANRAALTRKVGLWKLNELSSVINDVGDEDDDLRSTIMEDR